MLQKPYAVFDFTDEKPYSLLTVPTSWVIQRKEVGKTSQREGDRCYWPQEGSPEEKQVLRLISSCSTPGTDWRILSGRLKGTYATYKQAEAVIRDAVNQGVCTTTEVEDESTKLKRNPKEAPEARTKEKSGSSPSTSGLQSKYFLLFAWLCNRRGFRFPAISSVIEFSPTSSM